MSGFLIQPAFSPPQYNIPIGSTGQVLTNVGGRLAMASASGGSGIGTYLSVAPAAGIHNDYNPAGFGIGVGRLDIDTTAGNIELTGIEAGADAQLLIVTNIGINSVLLDALNAGSAAANRFRLSGQFALPQYACLLFVYTAGTVNKWCKAG